MSADENAPKIHVDQDWKAQAQAEKEKLEKQETEQAKNRPSQQRGELPPADFRALVGTLASQAIMGLGAYADPKTGKVMIDLEGAQFSIDLLALLEEKTKNNLSEDEAKDMTQVLSELRNQYVHIAQLVAKQQAAQAAGGAASAPSASKLVQP